MRMWNVPPHAMCNQHLLGEHLEMHMFKGCLNRGKSIKGYIKKGLVNTGQITDRHNALASEMIARGMRHKSPLRIMPLCPEGHVDSQKNLAELARRCTKCRERIERRYGEDE